MTTKFLRKFAALTGAACIAFGLAAPAAQAAGNDYPNLTETMIE